MYHKWSSDDTDTATYLFGTAEGDVRAGHMSRFKGDITYATGSDVAPSSVFDGNVGAVNTLAIRTGHGGSVLEMNGKVVLQVPFSKLLPRSYEMLVCIGLFSDETENYSIDYYDLVPLME